MTSFTTDCFSFKAFPTTDALRPALLLTGAQIVIALVAAVLLTNGLLG